MNGQASVAQVGELPINGRSGVLAGFVSEQLNANFVMLEHGEAMAAHTNDEVDVVIVVQSGEGVLTIDDELHRITVDSLAIVPRGTSREIVANGRLLYFTIHQRREGLTVQPSPTTKDVR